MEIPGIENVTRTASPISTVTNQIALPFEDHLEERFSNSQNFFQRHNMCLGLYLSRCTSTTDIGVATQGLAL